MAAIHSGLAVTKQIAEMGGWPVPLPLNHLAQGTELA